LYLTIVKVEVSKTSGSNESRLRNLFFGPLVIDEVFTRIVRKIIT